MGEALVAAAIFVTMTVTAVVSHNNSWFSLLQIGCATLGAGTLLSFLTGGMYHLRLSQTAACRAGKIPKWWWTPTRLHAHISRREQLRVLPWFWAGATSFGLVLLGAVWAVLAVSRMGG